MERLNGFRTAGNRPSIITLDSDKDEKVDIEHSASDSTSLENGDVSKTEREPPSEKAESTIPDGGLRAWLQVLSGFMLYLNSWGIVTAFGVFESFYVSTYLPGETSSSIAWIGTIQGFLLAFITIFAGPILDRGHPHLLVMTGGFMVVFGLMMTSLGTTYWQLFLAQGVCVGLGSGQLFIVAVALIPQYFDKYRALTTGICAAGSAVGGIIYPIVFHRLEPIIGFGWAVRVLGFIALFCILVSLAVVKMRTLPPPRPKIVDFSGFREVIFTLFCLLSFLGAMGLYIPYFFISDYAREREGLPSELSFYMLPILASGGLIGRTVPAMIADRLGCLETLTFTTTVSALLAFSWIAVKDSSAGLIAWALLYGIFSGPFVSLQTPTIAAITPDMRIVGGRMGMATFCLALGVLVGNPIAGVIQVKSWVGLQIFCGSTLMLSAALTAVTLVMKGRQDRANKQFKHNNQVSNWEPSDEGHIKTSNQQPQSARVAGLDDAPIEVDVRDFSQRQ